MLDVFYSLRDTLNLFKTHIWGLIEYHTSAIYHACDSHRSRLDRLQSSFLNELGIGEKDALLVFNFAPLNSRRDIAMLAVLHKRVLGIAHHTLISMFPFSSYQPAHRHNKQLALPIEQMIFQQALWMRSLFDLTQVYNRLPQRIVDLTTIKEFQHELTCILKQHCSRDAHSWSHIFDPRAPSAEVFA